ncbi:ribonuclease P protein component [Pandoraea terrae]|uniref:Ribonuclease P protein component n=2 Tax=Pandoraea terrae TaxID=1537710 RepID=A0A5E4VXF2_9BURK|nr:ribonuclease P protein component [Pandoraea terrae]
MRPRELQHLPVPASGCEGRIGIVVGKKHAPRAVTRNLIKRQAREMFRQRRADLAGWDFVLRLTRRFDKGTYEAAAAPVLKTLVQAEFTQLFAAALDRANRDKPERNPTTASGPSGQAPPNRPPRPD